MQIDYILFEPKSLLGEDVDKAIMVERGADDLYSVDTPVGSETLAFSIHGEGELARIPVYAYAYQPQADLDLTDDVGVLLAAAKTATELTLTLVNAAKSHTWLGAVLTIGTKANKLPDGRVAFFMGIALRKAK